MVIKIFIDPSQYLKTVQPMLEAHESRNNLMLGIALRLVEHPDWIDAQPYLSAVLDDDGQPRLVALITSPNNLLLAAEPSVSTPWLNSAIQAVVHSLQTGGWGVPGVMAENSLAISFAQVWSRAAGVPYRAARFERTYELRRVIPPISPAPGRLRQATISDIDLVAVWHLAFTLEALGKGSEEESLKAANRWIPAGTAFLWENGEPVSMAVLSRPTPHGCTVTCVYTPPSMRGQGYASACVAALSKYLLDSGKQFCNLFTDLANPTSNSIYQKIGYYPVCDFTEMRFGS